mgnify:CR=1 FL=1
MDLIIQSRKTKKKIKSDELTIELMAKFNAFNVIITDHRLYGHVLTRLRERESSFI